MPTPKEEAESCPVTKAGHDSHIGDWYRAPCGWSTYNRYDISHYAWHRGGYAPPAKEPEEE
jgi:hypothetical protein